MKRMTGLAILLLLVACDPVQDPQQEARDRLSQRSAELDSVFTDCPRHSRTRFATLVASARCLTFQRPENPAEPEGRSLDLRVMVLPAVRPVPEPDPLVVLVGGPGQAATEAGLMIARLLQQVNQRRDIVLMDQRGTGENSPFQCDFSEEGPTPEGELEALLSLQTEQIRDCLARTDADPRWYTTDVAVQDLEALRRYLGYDRFNLWGGSYGTRVALAYLGEWPEHTRSVVLDGAAPTALRLPLNAARDASRALEQVFSLCDSQPDCAATFPDLRGDFTRLLDTLEQPLDLTLQDFRDLAPVEMQVGGDLLRVVVRSLLYSREGDRLLPLLINRFASGDYQSLVPLLDASPDINTGMFLSVVCNEDVSLATEAEREAALQENHLLSSELLVRPILEACDLWPHRTLDPGYFEPVSSDRPVLILSGALDPVTPPRWGDEVLSHLDNARHAVVEGVAHITLPYGCVARRVARFIENPQPMELDLGCLERIAPRPFLLDVGGGTVIDD